MDNLDNTRLDDLMIKDAHIIQYIDGYSFTSDSVFLANLVESTKDYNILELGTGSGIISLLIAIKKQVNYIKAIEIQEKYCVLAKKNVEINNLEDKIKIVKADIKDYKDQNLFDVVVVNPPYFKRGSGLRNKKEEIEIARSEKLITLAEIFECANRNLKNKGFLYMVIKADRMQEVFNLCNTNNFAIKDMKMLKPNQKKEVDAIVFKAVKNAKLGIHIDTICIYDEKGNMTKEASKYYE